MFDESIWKEVETHRAIPRGGVQLLAHLTASIVSSAVLLFMGYLALNATGTTTNGVLAWSCMVLASTVIWWQLMLSPERRQWLRTYWKKNVRGYAVCWVANADGSITSHPVYPRGKDPNPDGIGFFLPLGGWFTMSYVTWRMQPTRWRVAWGSRIYQDNLEVCITDGSGMRMCMPITDALAIFAKYHVLIPLQMNGADMSFTWADVLFTTRKQRDDARRDRDETQRQLNETREALATTIRERDAAREENERKSDAVRDLLNRCEDLSAEAARNTKGRNDLWLKAVERRGFLVATANALLLAHRLNTSLEAQRIAAMVARQIIHISADDPDPLAEWREKLGVIEARIQALERRDRARHGRKRKATAEVQP